MTDTNMDSSRNDCIDNALGIPDYSWTPASIINSEEEFLSVVSKDAVIHNSIVLKGDDIKDLNPAKGIIGSLGLSNCLLETLSPVEFIQGEIWCSFREKASCLRTLGSLKEIDGDASFHYTPLESIGDLERIKGNLSLRDTKISNLGNLKYVGGNLSLPARLKGKVNLDSITIGGKVRYWNDRTPRVYPTIDTSLLSESPRTIPLWPKTYIYPNHDMREEPQDVQSYYRYFSRQFEKGIVIDTKGSSNYFFMLFFDLQRKYSDPDVLAEKFKLLEIGCPAIKPYADDCLLDLFKRTGRYQDAWNSVLAKEYLSITTVREFIQKLGYGIFNGEIAVRLAGYSCLTQFGRKNLKEIIPFFQESLSLFERERNSSFFEVFIEPGRLYKRIDGEYSSEYYKQFYRLDTDSFEYYNSIDNDEYHSRSNGLKLVVEHAILEQIRILLIDSEDRYRVSIGSPKIGEGWINETALFYRIKAHFPEYEVVHHGRPSWLGRQHLDIYFPSVKIAVEYQGLQHFQPVDYFGGEEGFKKNKERDERKKSICDKNGCVLLYVEEGYDFEEVSKMIYEAIHQQKNNGKQK